MNGFPDGLEPVRDLTPAGWVEDALKGWPSQPFRVRDLVPPAFEAYARILHRVSEHDHEGHQRSVKWADRSAELDRALGPETKWWDLLGVAPNERDLDEGAPSEGSLTGSEAATLASFLASNAGDSSTCWFALWSGFGFLGGPEILDPEPGSDERSGLPHGSWRSVPPVDSRATFATFDLLGQSGRSYLLFRGVVQDAARFTFHGWFQSPTLWWPDDRAWFVHTEIDAMSTYLGASRVLVDRLVGQQVLESFEVEPNTLAGL